MQSDNQASKQRESSTPRVLTIELFALELNRCTRCVGTLRNIEKAIEIIRPALEVMGVHVKVETTIIESEAQARRHRFATSPTVRINGKDIAFEMAESECDACTDLCGGDDATSCRVWLYRGQEYTEAPVGFIVESILREILVTNSESTNQTPAYSEVPDNLRRFFKRRQVAGSAGGACCSPADLETCCETRQGSNCCDGSQPEPCGCR